MIYLLDTNVVSELRKSPVQRGRSGKADRNVLRWSRAIPIAFQFLSVVSILELEYGALLMERRDLRQGTVFRSWVDQQVRPAFDGRILPIDTEIALKSAALHIPNPRPERDALIAATAMVHGLIVVTRNVAHFNAMDVPLLNPWDD
jgi:toxin FitB